MKAQVSLEYMMVLVILMTMALPAGYFFYQYSDSSANQITSAQIETLGRAIVINSEGVYYSGEPSRMTIQGRLPANVVSINISNNWAEKLNEIVFVTEFNGKRSEQPYPSRVNINGTFYQRDFAEGIKNVLLEAYKKKDGTVFVFINFDGRCPASPVYNLRDDDCLVDVDDRNILTGCIDQNKTSAVWNDRWNTCMKADYDGDCVITNFDLSIFDPHIGETVC
jgi:hypothetical protein